MNIKRMFTYAIYYIIWCNLMIALSVGLLDYFEGCNWKLIITLNIIWFVAVAPLMNYIENKINKHIPNIRR